MLLPSLAEGSEPRATQSAVSILEEVYEIRKISSILEDDFNMKVTHRENNGFGLFGGTIKCEVLEMRWRAILIGVNTCSFKDSNTGGVTRGADNQ